MIIIGIGTDIEEVSRFEDRNSSFLKKCFTEKETEYAFKHKNYAQHLCGRFCAKEALSKALGHSGKWHEAEIMNSESGKPYFVFYGELKEEVKDYYIELSISHCRNYATGVVAVFKKEGIK